jgi:pantoate--beta-alanine ligase
MRTETAFRIERNRLVSQVRTGTASSRERPDGALQTVCRVADLRAVVAAARDRGAKIGLVPTMGAFHEGHLSLMRRARAECDTVVVSLFVNPSQFTEGEDLESYPRDLARDTNLAREIGVDLLFAPSFEEVYPAGFATTVEVAGLTERLCGAPDQRGAAHFRGVATVVVKLLNMCQPDVAFFGAKDYQQAVVVRRLVRDLDLAVRIEVCPIVRDSDGVALSSRNAYLSADERERALALSRALRAAERAVELGLAHVAEPPFRGRARRHLVRLHRLERISDDQEAGPVDSLHGLDGVSEALVGPDEAEGEHRGAVVRSGRIARVDRVRDHAQLALFDSQLREGFTTALAVDDDAVKAPEQGQPQVPLGRRSPREDVVGGEDGGPSQPEDAVVDLGGREPLVVKDLSRPGAKPDEADGVLGRLER